MPQKKFVEVVVKATKRKQWVPEHLLDHPTQGPLIELPPSARAAAKKKTAAASLAADQTPATGDDKEK